MYFIARNQFITAEGVFTIRAAILCHITDAAVSVGMVTLSPVQVVGANQQVAEYSLGMCLAITP